MMAGLRWKRQNDVRGGPLRDKKQPNVGLAGLPDNLVPRDQQPYDGPAIGVDWTRRPPYAVTRREALTPDKRRTIRWVEVYMRPVTFQIVDLAAYRSAVEVLQLAHKTAAAVCLDGDQHRFDPTDASYRPTR